MKDKRKTLDTKCDSLDLQKIRKSQQIRERGITLIALVVTIIILLILSGVTLDIALSDNGLFKRAQEAADKYKKAQEDEEDILEELENQLDNLTSIRDAKASKYEFEKTRTLSDINGNKVVIPGKFHIASDSGITVQEGIVIEDSDGNQFVWVPVSNINGDNNASTKEVEQKKEDLIILNDGSKVEITLGRYIFKNNLNGNSELEDGTPILVQEGLKVESDEEEFKLHYISSLGKADYEENTKLERKSGEAKNLKEFIDSVEKNHGYYIARYEAGKETDDNNLVSKAGQAVWSNVTQPKASIAAREMYKDGDEEAKYVESDLVNSYAWDTAIVFIETMEDKNYANMNRAENEIKKTGCTGDEECHIFDMAGNVWEWTTENCSSNEKNEMSATCVVRGGSIDSGKFASIRHYGDDEGNYVSLRLPPTFIFKIENF